jgi:hypothetical protein
LFKISIFFFFKLRQQSIYCHSCTGFLKAKGATCDSLGNAKATDHSAAHATRKEKNEKEEKRKVMK